MNAKLQRVAGALLILGSLPLGATSVQLIDLPGRVEPAAPTPAVFGNREQALDLEITDAVAQSGALSAELFRVSSSNLAVPIGGAIPLQSALTLTGGPSQKLHVSLKFPDIKARSEILVRLSLVPPAPATAVPLGEFKFEVFPATITKELTDLLQPGADGVTRVVLFGAGRKLHSFLAQVHVNYDDAGTSGPDRFETNRLYFGEATATDSIQTTQEMGMARTVVFTPDESLPPGVYIDPKSTGVIRVTLPLLDNIADDPRAQLAFIKIIHLLST